MFLVKGKIDLGMYQTDEETSKGSFRGSRELGAKSRELGVGSLE